MQYAYKLLIICELVCGAYATTKAVKNTLPNDFLAAVNAQLAILYDKEVVAKLQNELLGPNDLVALLQAEIANEQIVNYIKGLSPKVSKFKRLGLGDELQRRQLSKIPVLGYEALGNDDLALLYAVTANMSDSYDNALLCAYETPSKCDLKLIPHVQNILHASENLNEIAYYWFEWRRKTGLAVRSDFEQFIELYIKTARLNGYAQASDYWFRDFGMRGDEAMQLLTDLMHRLRPLFLQFHAHVRGALRKQYGVNMVPKSQPYPQHLAEIFLGNAYRHPEPNSFVNYPYPALTKPNITALLQQVGLSTIQRIYWNGAEYFRALGYPQLQDNFWLHAKSKRAHEADHCWHKAWQYYGLSQINFTYCPLVDEERFLNMFEALSDVYNYQAYRRQPTVLRDEPMPNFSDALGKFHALAASSPRHLAKLGLLKEDYSSKPARLNRLYLQGLRLIFLMPVFYVLERYRVLVLNGSNSALDNMVYWQLTEYYTGAAPPSPRTNVDFDVPAKLLMEVDDQYTGQMLSIVLQFQLYKHYCLATKQFVPGDTNWPLDLCDLSEQRLVGTRIYHAMQLGASENYKTVLQALLDVRELDLDGLLTYFEPLKEWLVDENRANDNEVGW